MTDADELNALEALSYERAAGGTAVAHLTEVVKTVRWMRTNGSFLGPGVMTGAQKVLDAAADGLGLRVVLVAGAPYSWSNPGIRLDVEGGWRRGAPRGLAYLVDQVWHVTLTGRVCVKSRYVSPSGEPGILIGADASVDNACGEAPFVLPNGASLDVQEVLSGGSVKDPGSWRVAQDIANVQPMKAPSAEIFRMDYRYDSGPGAIDRSRFPHSCPRCGSPAYVGFSSAECSRAGCV